MYFLDITIITISYMYLKTTCVKVTVAFDTCFGAANFKNSRSSSISFASSSSSKSYLIRKNSWKSEYFTKLSSKATNNINHIITVKHMISNSTRPNADC